VAVVVLVDLAPAAWGWLRLALGSGPLDAVPGICWGKVLGSGYQGGFGLRPSFSRQGLFCLFADPASAASFLEASPLIAAYRRRAREFFSVTLLPYSSRGTWSGRVVPVATEAPVSGPVATLTRASIRWSRMVDFWRHAPATQGALLHASGCRLAVGLGEAPVLRQATFSIWDSAADIDAYAREGPHLHAARAAHAGSHFSEAMFLRFIPVEPRGQWRGTRFE
jgi:hypothetical protein